MSPDRDSDAARRQEGPEDLLARCLEASDFDAEVERACVEHPELADELRRRRSALRRAGLAPSQPAYFETLQPRQLGPYRLVERIGGGGMGVVWRCVEEPFGREVAVKLVRAEHLHLDSARRRFLREIEAVSALQHPGILPVYSCGEHGDVPYYAMELVPGRSAGQVLATLQGRDVADLPPSLLGVADRSSWPEACCVVAARVARALQHAHERSIVHRDVKPSNIMLADDGRVLLIDFGLAQLDGAESVTRSGVQPGSPTYMSPEQVRGEHVDHRTDIWSLGVTLYELLSLRLPFAGESTAEMRRQILDASPPPLAERVPQVSWEVATIVAAALAPEPERRYQTAAAFAADLEAALEHRPIAARRPNALLRLRRYVQRHQVLATAVGLLFLLVTVLPTALLVQARAANAEIREKAATAQTTVAFLQGLFREVEPERARGTSLPVRVFLDRGVQRARSELADQPQVHAALLETLATVYLDLGLFAEAEQVLAELEPLRAGSPAEERVPLLSIRARLCGVRVRFAEAERLWRAVLDLLPALGGGQDDVRVDATLRLAEVIWLQDRLDEAEPLFDQVIAALRRQDPVRERLLLDALLRQADFLASRRDPLRAQPLLEEIQELADRNLAKDHPQRISVADRVAACATLLGDAKTAEQLLRRALVLAEQILDARHPGHGSLHMSLAAVLLGSDNAQASAEMDEALEVFTAIHRAPHPVLASAWNMRSNVDYELGDFAACAQSLDAALAMYEQLSPAGGIEFAAVLGNMCRLHAAMGRTEEAVAAGRRSVEMAREHGITGVEQLAMSLGHFAYALALMGQLEQAKEHIEEAMRLFDERPSSHALAFVQSYAAEIACFSADAAGAEKAATEARRTWQHLDMAGGESWAMHVLGWSLELQGRLPEAEAILRETVQLRRRWFGDSHPLLALSLSQHAVVLARSGRLEDAATSLAESVAICRSTFREINHNLVMPLLNYGAVLDLLGRTDEALPIAVEVADLVEGKVPVGHRYAEGTARLMLRLRPKLEDPDARARFEQRLKAFVARMLPGDHPARREAERQG